MPIWKRLLLLPPVILGVALVYWATSNRSQPETAEITERQTPVAFIEVQPQSFVPSVTSFGTVQPAHSWDAVAQVRGRVDHLHPDFMRGGVIRAGEDAVRIAADKYELAVAQAEANILSAAAQIEELDANANPAGAVPRSCAKRVCATTRTLGGVQMIERQLDHIGVSLFRPRAKTISANDVAASTNSASR